MTTSLLLALSFPTFAAEPMDLLNKLAGHRWFTSLALPDKYENIVNGYVKNRDGSIVGSGTAQAIGEKPLVLASKYSPTRDKSVVTYTDRQGTTKLRGTVRREGDKIVLLYGAEGGKEDSVKEVLSFADADHSVDGEVYSRGKLVLTYRMRRIDAPAPIPVLEGKDPVLLTQGKSAVGKGTLTADYEGYRYTFATAETKAQFLKEPALYAVQFGGACMNMGPLSGRGQPFLYEVFQNRLYLFASTSCRETFLKSPEAFLDQLDEPVKVTPAALTQTIAVLDKAAMAHGNVDAMTSIFRVRNTTYKDNGRDVRYDLATWSNFKDTFADAQAYDGATLATLLSPKSSWMGTLREPGPLVASEQDFFRRQNMRDLFAILKNRRTPGFIAELLGPKDVAELKGQIAVKTSFKGATTIVYLDPGTHAVNALQHQERLGQDVLKVFSDFKDVDGVRVPFQVTTITMDGKKSVLKFDAIKVNEPLQIMPVGHPLLSKW